MGSNYTVVERIITKSFARLMGRGTHRGFITYEELSKSLGKRNLSDENLSQAFIHILDENITLVEKKSDFKVLRKKKKKKKKKEISEKLVSSKPEIIFHLAAIVSGQAEEEFDLGWNINTKGSWGLFEAIRELGDDYKPRLVFTSSIAVFGAPFPEKIPDDFFTTPLTSY